MQKMHAIKDVCENVTEKFFFTFTNFKANRAHELAKKTKNVFYNCVFEFPFASISGSDYPFCQKGLNWCALLCIDTCTIQGIRVSKVYM